MADAVDDMSTLNLSNHGTNNNASCLTGEFSAMSSHSRKGSKIYLPSGPDSGDCLP